MAKSAAVSAAEKIKRKAREERRDKISLAAAEIEDALYEMIEAKAKILDVKVTDIQSRFLLYATACANDSKLTVWNGLVHLKSKEWADKKDDYPGSAFIGYVVERIHKENLYNIDEMSEEDQQFYIDAARQSRAAKLNAGAAKTSTQRLVQGSVKTEISAMVQRLQFLHSTTGVECLLFAVKGRSKDSLIGMYHSTPKAQTFLENHLALPIAHFVELMEGSVLGGVVGALNSHRTPTQIAKTLFRQEFLKSLRIAATSAAEDGSAPVISDPLQISMVEYKNYPTIVRQYKVVLKGWPFDPNGSLVDPGTMGLAKLRSFTKLINDPKSDFGFKQITNSEWEEWCQNYDKEVATGSHTLTKRKTRSDAGTKRKKDTPNAVNALEMARSAASTKKKRVNNPKKSKGTKRPSKKNTSLPDHGDLIDETASRETSPSNNSQAIVRVSGVDPDETLTTDGAFISQSFMVTLPDGAPTWPAPVVPTPSTPKPQNSPLPNLPILAGSPVVSVPETPKKIFQFVHNTPESIRSHSCTPRPQRSQSTTTHTFSSPLSSHPGVFQGTNIPLVLDPALNTN